MEKIIHEINLMLDDLARVLIRIILDLALMYARLRVMWSSRNMLMRYRKKGVLVEWSEQRNLYGAFFIDEPEICEYGEDPIDALLCFLSKHQEYLSSGENN
ncbi:MAG: hypothetical protein EH225_08610 [Calditrichaeota bacterium]|nr:MAG: hypothetical protein EH225_08610 [Calditrichota bacterium]